MKNIILLLFLILSLSVFSQIKTYPSPVKIERDTLNYSEWMEFFHTQRADVTFIKYKEDKIETLVYHYQRRFKKVKFVTYHPYELGNGTIEVQTSYWVVPIKYLYEN